jgi:hypothetical protein
MTKRLVLQCEKCDKRFFMDEPGRDGGRDDIYSLKTSIFMETPIHDRKGLGLRNARCPGSQRTSVANWTGWWWADMRVETRTETFIGSFSGLMQLGLANIPWALYVFSQTLVFIEQDAWHRQKGILGAYRMPVEDENALISFGEAYLRTHFPEAVAIPARSVERAVLRKNRFGGVLRGAHTLRVSERDGDTREWYISSKQKAADLANLLGSVLHDRLEYQGENGSP